MLEIAMSAGRQGPEGVQLSTPRRVLSCVGILLVGVMVLALGGRCPQHCRVSRTRHTSKANLVIEAREEVATRAEAAESAKYAVAPALTRHSFPIHATVFRQLTEALLFPSLRSPPNA